MWVELKIIKFFFFNLYYIFHLLFCSVYNFVNCFPDYIDELMEEVILRREVCDSFRSAKESRILEEMSWPSADNGTRQPPPPLAHSTPHRASKQVVVESRISRFNK